MTTSGETPSGEERKDPMHLALLWTMQRTKFIASVQDYDEESYTSTVLGGAAIAAPLLAVFAGHDSTDQASCSFGTFRKSGGAKTPLSETATGADFCLVIGHDEEHAKVAIFQAKKFQANVKSRTLSVRRGPAESAEGHYQLTMLLAFACRIMETSDKSGYSAFSSDANSLISASKLEKSGKDEIKKLVTPIDWVHYVIYQDGEATTVPLNAIDDDCINAELAKGTPKSHQLKSFRAPFIDTITSGLSGETQGWFVIPRTVIKNFLPELVEMGAVVVVDEKGGAGLTPNIECVNTASLLDTPFIVEHTQDYSAVKAMISTRPTKPGGPF